MRVSKRSLLAILAAVALLLSVSVGTTLAAGGRTLTTVMTGAQEVPGPGDPNAAGTAVITLNPGLGTVCYALAWTNASGDDTNPDNDAVWGGHIHTGAAGSAGPVFISLFQGTSFGANDSTSGCVSATRAAILAVLTNPAGYYVNIHSDEYPGGIIRGQLG